MKGSAVRVRASAFTIGPLQRAFLCPAFGVRRGQKRASIPIRPPLVCPQESPTRPPAALSGRLRPLCGALGLADLRPPLAVAAALGHASAETTWKYYAHLFDEARLASATDPETAIRQAREAVLAEIGLRASQAGS